MTPEGALSCCGDAARSCRYHGTRLASITVSAKSGCRARKFTGGRPSPRVCRFCTRHDPAHACRVPCATLAVISSRDASENAACSAHEVRSREPASAFTLAGQLPQSLCVPCAVMGNAADGTAAWGAVRRTVATPLKGASLAGTDHVTCARLVQHRPGACPTRSAAQNRAHDRAAVFAGASAPDRRARGSQRVAPSWPSPTRHPP